MTILITDHPEDIQISTLCTKKLLALAEKADLEPSFLLEYLIYWHGAEAVRTFQQDSSLSSPECP